MRSLKFVLLLQSALLITTTAALGTQKLNYDLRGRYYGTALFHSCDALCPPPENVGGYPTLKDSYGNTELCQCVKYTEADRKEQEKLKSGPAAWKGRPGELPAPKSPAQLQSEDSLRKLVEKCQTVKGYASLSDWYGKVDSKKKIENSHAGFKHEGCSPLPDGMQCTAHKSLELPLKSECRVVHKIALVPTDVKGECAPSEMSAPKYYGEACPDLAKEPAVEKVEKQSTHYCVPDPKGGRKVTDAWWDVDLTTKAKDSCACPSGYAFRQEHAGRATCIQTGGKCPIGKIADEEGNCSCPEGFTELKSGQCACSGKVVWSNPPFCPSEESCANRGLAFVGKKCSEPSSVEHSASDKSVTLPASVGSKPSTSAADKTPAK